MKNRWKNTTADERFSKRYSKTPSGCWEWDRPEPPGGYGSFCVDSKKFRVHRWALTRFKGPPTNPNKAWALHHCDNRRCVNPDHLYWGDIKDNMRDCASRGRYFFQKNKIAARDFCLRNLKGVSGEKNSNTKLGLKEISECFALRDAGMQHKEIMKRMNVGRTAIQSALYGKTALSREFLKGRSK